MNITTSKRKERIYERMKRDIFISHSSKDNKLASELCEYLEANGKSCFIAPRDIRYGKEYAEEIVDGIDDSKAMILLLSEQSNQSPHVLREVERAVSKSIPILIYKLENVELSKSMEYFLMAHQWLDAKMADDFSNILKCIDEIRTNNLPESKEIPGELSGKKQSFLKAHKVPVISGVLAACVLIAVLIFAFSGSDKEKQKTDKQNSDSKNIIENQENNSSDSNGDGATTAGEEHTGSQELKVGDTITFGQYQNEKIEWRVLKISEDKKEAVLIAKDILSMKAFDAAEGGTYNVDADGKDYYQSESEADTNLELQIEVRGNNDWSTSNIRTWLNSEEEVVKYEDQAPTTTAMSEKKNGYNNEPGFLYEFQEEELAAIKTVQNKTTGNALSKEKEIETEDRVWLLSMEELEWFDEAGISMLAKPTAAAFEQDDADWFYAVSEVYSVEEYCWWLREPVEGTSSKCYMVGNGYLEENIFERVVGLEGYGIRPAITVDIEKLP